MSTKSYLEMSSLSEFIDRYNYLKSTSKVGDDTFGSRRYLNQILYRSKEWKQFRDKVIIRDNGCDLGVEGRPISGKIIIHHLNPLTIEDVMNRNSCVFDMNNVVCVSHITHEAIHYGSEDILITEPIERSRNDTCPWKK